LIDNLNIDGLYAESEKENAQSEPEDTQVNTSQENNLINNLSSNRNSSSRNRFQLPENLLGLFLPENLNSSSPAAPVTSRSINAKEDYNEYKDLNYKCMGSRANKGNIMMINNYKSVLRAGIIVSSG
jgi:hypothetical protein